jgi:regulator of protease activity HflC (stomatin/prohibitin superfamily)
MNYNRNIIPLMAGGILILAITTILRPFVIIDTGERGVVMYFGKVQKQIRLFVTLYAKSTDKMPRQHTSNPKIPKVSKAIGSPFY